jgi:hypothetical protein
MSNVSIRIIERAIESAENPSGMSTHDGMARVPACHLRRLLAELAEARRDVEQAAGELIVAMPEPGTDMARVMLANAMMRRERDEARRDRNALRGWLDAVRRYLPPDATEARDIVRDALDGET